MNLYPFPLSAQGAHFKHPKILNYDPQNPPNASVSSRFKNGYNSIIHRSHRDSGKPINSIKAP